MKLEKRLALFFTRSITATPRGRAHLLNQIADAEDNGEARVFDDALSLVDDPKLAKMIERHRDDEIRHGRLFRECMKRTGIAPYPVPEHLKAIERLDAHVGGFFQQPIRDTKGVMTAYLILQVLEERALEQFPMYMRVFKEAGDEETSRVFEEVAGDEERHLKYCHAISRRYASSEEELASELTRLRQVEARAFKETQQANMIYVREENILPYGFARAVSAIITTIAPRIDFVPMTQFA